MPADSGDRRIFRNFQVACAHYKFPGSHQCGSFGPKGTGIVRTYSNATLGKDLVLDDGALFLYRLKDEAVRAQFKVNQQRKKAVRVFRRVSQGVADLGLYQVEGFVPAESNQQAEVFGAVFVRFVREIHVEAQITDASGTEATSGAKDDTVKKRKGAIDLMDDDTEQAAQREEKRLKVNKEESLVR